MVSAVRSFGSRARLGFGAILAVSVVSALVLVGCGGGDGGSKAETGSKAGKAGAGGNRDSDARICRVSIRGYNGPDNRDRDLGFRLVLSP